MIKSIFVVLLILFTVNAGDSKYLHIKKNLSVAKQKLKDIGTNKGLKQSFIRALIGEIKNSLMDRKSFTQTTEGGYLIEIPDIKQSVAIDDTTTQIISWQKKIQNYVNKNPNGGKVEFLTKEQAWAKLPIYSQ